MPSGSGRLWRLALIRLTPPSHAGAKAPRRAQAESPGPGRDAGLFRNARAFARAAKGLLLLESRREVRAEGLIRMELLGALDQYFLALGNVGVGDTAIHGADRGALFLVKETDAFGAFLRNNVIDVFLQCGARLSIELPGCAAFIDGGIRALRLARAAVNAFFRNQCRHILTILQPQRTLA